VASVSGFRLAEGLVADDAGDDPTGLLVSAALVWYTNVIVAALWHWEFDKDWEPTFLDCLSCRSPTRQRSVPPHRRRHRA
jgi:hypothetical protein